MFKLKKNSSEEKIKKSKEIIKEEKRKIKEEKKKIKSHTKKKPKKHIEKEIYTSKEVVISIVISMILGAVICISAVLLTMLEIAFWLIVGRLTPSLSFSGSIFVIDYSSSIYKFIIS